MMIEDMPVSDVASPEPRSFGDDVHALIADGKTYLEAELQFQKSRLSATASQGQSVLICAVAGLILLLLALIALTVGTLFALIPLLTAWGATAVVGGVLLLATAVALLMAKGRVDAIRTTLKGEN